jgi:hypothetical protein
MVFPISNPTSLPDIATTPAQKIRTDAVNKVAPVVLNDQVSVDPRTAVNLAIPAGQLAESALARNPLADANAQLGQLSAEQVLEGQTQNLATTISKTLLDPLAPDLGQLLIALDAQKSSEQLVVTWPTNQSAPESPIASSSIKQGMDALLQGLIQSPMFSAQELAATLGGFNQTLNIEETAQLRKKVTDLLDNISTDTPATKEGAKLLLHGILQWQGNLIPGVQAKIRREDAWESDVHHPGQVIKGSKISVELGLPNTGTFKVVGTQFGEVVRLQIDPSPSSQKDFSNHLADLTTRLQEQVDLPVACRIGETNA